jgi:hypothetical protein
MTRAICGGALWWAATENPYLTDCLDSTLFAQLAADKRASRFNQTEAWFSEFSTILATLGWQNASFAYRPFALPSIAFTLEEVIDQSLRDHISPRDMAGLLASLTAYDDLPVESRARSVFDDMGSLEYILCPGMCVLGGDGAVVELGVRVEQTPPPLHERIGPEFSCIGADPGISFRREIPVSEVVGKVYTASSKMSLNEDIYSKIRELVIEKLCWRRAALTIPF